MSVHLRNPSAVQRCGLLGTLCSFVWLVGGCARGALPEPFLEMPSEVRADGGALDASTEPEWPIEDDPDPNPNPNPNPNPERDAASEPVDPEDGSLGEDPPQMNCMPGVYNGSFSGEITVLGFLNLPIDGSISIQVRTSDVGASLSIEDGTIEGSDQDGNPVIADVEGVLNCTTNKLENGVLKNGTYTRKALNSTVAFEGTVTADYVPGPVPSIKGTWKTVGGRIEEGAGVFESSYVSP